MKIELPSAVRRRLRGHLRAAGFREIGGVLMGEQLRIDHFRVVDFTVDAITGSRAHFVRSTEQHQIALDDFFARTNSDYRRFNYLGEWHSHPSFPVNPSATDVSSMNDLVNGERSIDFAVLLILRLDWYVHLRNSASLFVRGQQPQKIETIIN